MTHLQKWKKDQGEHCHYFDISFDIFLISKVSLCDWEIADIFKGKEICNEAVVEALMELTGLSRAQILNEE